MRGPVKWGEFEPRFEITEHLFRRAWKVSDQMLEDRGVANPKAAPLCSEPAIELRVAVDLETVQEIACEQC